MWVWVCITNSGTYAYKNDTEFKAFAQHKIQIILSIFLNEHAYTHSTSRSSLLTVFIRVSNTFSTFFMSLTKEEKIE